MGKAAGQYNSGGFGASMNRYESVQLLRPHAISYREALLLILHFAFLFRISIRYSLKDETLR